MDNKGTNADLIGDSKYIVLGEPYNITLERNYVKGFGYRAWQDGSGTISIYIDHSLDPINYQYDKSHKSVFDTDVKRLKQQFK